MDSDIRVLEAEPQFTFHKARTPLKFGGVVMDACLFFKCRVKVENRKGNVADGYGGIFLADFWAWPSPKVPHDLREQVMKEVAEDYTELISGYRQFAHPIDIFLDTEPELKRITKEVCQRLHTAEEMPFLGALVCASAVDGALHDAFGNVNQIDTYLGYGKEFCPDLSHYFERLGLRVGGASCAAKNPGQDAPAKRQGSEAVKGKYIGDYLRPAYLPEVPVFHLVGGLDKLTRAELSDDDPQDGLPNCLEDWVLTDGLFCLKVKLRGNDLNWDLQRMIDVYRIGTEVQMKSQIPNPKSQIHLTADTNEMCETPDYMIDLLTKLREKAPEAFKALLYIEQPTHRDLKLYPFDMRKLAAIKPVFVDESLTDFESYELARELGATGIALKTCKGHSMCLLMVAKAHEDKVPYAVQDLTNPGIALIHSVGLAARIHTVMGVEANSRQFFPKASEREAKVHPHLFSRQGGVAKTHSLKGYGLGYQMERIMAGG